MNPWMLLVVMATGLFISILMRSQQRALRQLPPPRPMDNPTPRPDEEFPPLVRALLQPKRRLFQPAVAKAVAKAVPVVQVVPVSRPAAPPQVTPPRKATETAQQLVKMLQDPQSLRTAILLREVLDPPLCKRRR